MFPLRDTQPSYSKPVVTVLLIVVNILVFLFEVSLDPYSRNEFIAAYGLVPDQFSFLNVLTSMFLHGGWMHVKEHGGEHDVPSRRLDARAGQHVVPLDLRRQYRGHSGPRQVPTVLPVMRLRHRHGTVPR